MCLWRLDHDGMNMYVRYVQMGGIVGKTKKDVGLSVFEGEHEVFIVTLHGGVTIEELPILPSGRCNR